MPLCLASVLALCGTSWLYRGCPDTVQCLIRSLGKVGESSLQNESSGCAGLTPKFPLMGLIGTFGEILHACGRHQGCCPTCWTAQNSLRRKTLASVSQQSLQGIRQSGWNNLSCRGSLVLTPVAVGTGVALFAGTLVLVGPCVDARPSVQARLVGATIVQICGEGKKRKKKKRSVSNSLRLFSQNNSCRCCARRPAETGDGN